MILVNRHLPALAVALTLAGASVLAGCSNDSTSTASGAGSKAGTLSVIGEIYPLAWVAQKVGGDRVSVEQLIPAGSDVHGFELSPAQVTALGTTDLAITITSLATTVDEAMTANAPKTVIDVAKIAPTRPAVADEHGDEAHAAEAGGIDAHLWLNPNTMPTIADAVAAALAEKDPANAATFTANAASLTERFTALDGLYRTGLVSCERDTIVVTHPAFGYLTDAYGLTQVGVSGFDEETEPSPARLADIGAAAKAAGVTTILFAEGSNSKVATLLADELGLKTAELSQIISAPEGQDYVTLAERNLQTLRSVLSCS